MSLGLLGLALALLLVAILLRRSTGLPWSRVAYSDTRGWRRTEQPLITRRYGLVGKPDYLLETRGQVIPVEVKPSRQANAPYASDMLQLAAYCLLVEETTGARPPYGLLRYAQATFQVRYDDRLRNLLLQTLDEMHDMDESVSADRSHNEPGRCAACGFVEHCDQALV